MRAWILFGTLTAAAVGAAACGTQAAGPFADATGALAADADRQTMVRCEAGQHAVVNSATVSGRTVTSVDCVSDAPHRAPAPYQAAPAAYTPAPAPGPAVIRTASPAPVRVSDDVAVEQKPKRSWQKRAIVIGGSSGAGAGLGALIGGKKGALIGAAIGGGAGTVYEVTR